MRMKILISQNPERPPAHLSEKLVHQNSRWTQRELELMLLYLIDHKEGNWTEQASKVLKTKTRQQVRDKAIAIKRSVQINVPIERKIRELLVARKIE